MEEATFQEYLDKYMSGTLSAQESVQLDKYLAENPDMKEELEFQEKAAKVVRLDARQKKYQELSEIRAEMPVDTSSPKSDSSASQSSNSSIRWIIPLVLLVAVGSYFILRNDQQPAPTELLIKSDQINLALEEMIAQDIDSYTAVGFASDTKEADAMMAAALEQIYQGKRIDNNAGITGNDRAYLDLLMDIKANKTQEALTSLKTISGDRISMEKKYFLMALVKLNNQDEEGLKMMQQIASSGGEFSQLAKKALGNE